MFFTEGGNEEREKGGEVEGALEEEAVRAVFECGELVAVSRLRDPDEAIDDALTSLPPPNEQPKVAGGGRSVERKGVSKSGDGAQYV